MWSECGDMKGRSEYFFAAICVVQYLCVTMISSFENKTMSCKAIPVSHLDAADKVWDFLRLNDKLEKSDVILGLGSHDTRVAIEAAGLWLAGWADILAFSGCSGNLTSGKWQISEAEVFREIAISLGVPPMKIMIETRSKNTCENIRYTYRMLTSKGLLPKKIILVQKPHMGRRTLATFMKQWPERHKVSRTDVMVRTPDITLIRYPSQDVGDLSDVINVMVGYFQRLDLYYRLNFQEYVHIPEDVRIAYQLLVKSNAYNNHLA